MPTLLRIRPEPQDPLQAAQAARPNRVAVWVALSELFRDAELGPADWDAVASAIHAAGLSRAQARAVLDREVAPVFGLNLLSPTGAWTGWREAEVRDLVSAHLARGPVRRWAAVAGARMVRPLYVTDWDEVAARLPP